MTIPWLMNCAHIADGWCLNCVRAIGERDRMARELAEAKRSPYRLGGRWFMLDATNGDRLPLRKATDYASAVAEAHAKAFPAPKETP